MRYVCLKVSIVAKPFRATFILVVLNETSYVLLASTIRVCRFNVHRLANNKHRNCDE